MSRPLLASELFAMSQQAECEGTLECHWCGAPCKNTWPHNDQTPHLIRLGGANPNKATRPGDSYMCTGCQLWYRPSTTIQLLYRTQNGRIKQVDGQSPAKHSWWITEDDAWVITPICYPVLYEFLLNPPITFCLSLIDGSFQNRIHLSVVNDLLIVKKDTLLHFTINNIRYQYSVAELEATLKSGPNGREPGAQAILRLLGSCELDEVEAIKRNGPGRPPPMPDGRTTKKRVFSSGQQVTS